MTKLEQLLLSPEVSLDEIAEEMQKSHTREIAKGTFTTLTKALFAQGFRLVDLFDHPDWKKAYENFFQIGVNEDEILKLVGELSAESIIINTI